MIQQGMLKSTLILTLVCIIAAALLGATYLVTADRIDQQAVITLKENLNQVFLDADDFEEKEDHYIAKKDSNIIGYAAVAESQGYSSVLKILVGMDLDKKITGIRIIDQAETPGLGANAVKPYFYSQFDNLSSDKIALKKNNGEIDAITGATITSSAVINGVKVVLTEKLEKLVDGEESEIKEEPKEQNAQLANPASVYCIEQGGRLEIRTATDGSQSGYCIFEDNSECEEWAYYNKECPE